MTVPFWFALLVAAGWIYLQVSQQNKKAINEGRYYDVTDTKKTVFAAFTGVLVLGFIVAIILWFLSLFIDL